MKASASCPKCGATLTDATLGLCPRCLVELGIALNEPRASDSQPPLQSFGDYELLEELARGGMGVVYRARQISLNRLVALKMIRVGVLADASDVKRFQAEAEAIAHLQHPNIVAIHEVGEHDGKPYFSMDYIAGRTLAEIVREGPLPAKRAVAYLKTVAEAVHYAHQHGVIHRDLKPANVIIDQNDEPRITDFGLAKRVTQPSSESRVEGRGSSALTILDSRPSSLDLTVSGQVLGSPNYLPPEQAESRRGQVGPASDVYALGAILYHLLTGRPPFQAESLTTLLRAVIETDPVAPRLLNPSLSRDLETICLKCLEKERSRRYPTAQALADELGRFEAGEPIQARPVGFAGKTWRWCRRKPQVATLAGVAILIFVLGFVGVVVEMRRAQRGELTARQNVYAADMKEVQSAIEECNLDHAREMLLRHWPGKSTEPGVRDAELDLRGWEWRYLWERSQPENLSILCRCPNSVSAVALSFDGKWLAIHCPETNVMVWDVKAQRLVAKTPSIGWFKAMAFSPRTNLLALNQADTNGRAIILWDVSSRTNVARLPVRTNILCLTFSPNGEQLAALAADGVVRVWQLASEQLITSIQTEPRGTWNARLGSGGTGYEFSQHYGCLLYSPDGRTLAAGEGGPRIRLLNATIWQETLIEIAKPADGISALAFSPDGKLLAAGCGVGDNDVHIWDLETRNERRLSGHRDWIAGLCFSHDGQTLASASADSTIRLWNVTQGDDSRRFVGHTRGVWGVAWFPDDKTIVTGGQDGSVRDWDPAAKPVEPCQELPVKIWFWGPNFSADSETFIAPTWPGGAIVRWNTRSLREVERLSYLGTNHTSVDVSEDGGWLALGNKAGDIEVWDFKTRRLVKRLPFPEASTIFLVMFSPRAGILCAAADRKEGVGQIHGGYVGRFWAIADWHEITLKGSMVGSDVDYFPDGRTVAVGYEDGTAVWWDALTGERRGGVFNCGYSAGVAVAVSPDGKLFATAGRDGLMTLWDVATRLPKFNVRAFREVLGDLDFSMDGRRVVVTGTDPKERVKFWDIETGRQVLTLPGIPGKRGSFSRLRFSPDGTTLIAASLEGDALVWRARSLAEIEERERASQTK